MVQIGLFQCLKAAEIMICLPKQIRKMVIDKKNNYKWEVMAMPSLSAHGSLDGAFFRQGVGETGMEAITGT